MAEIEKKKLERDTKIIINTNGAMYIRIKDIPFDVIILKVVISLGNKFFHFTPQSYKCEIKEHTEWYEIPIPIELKNISDAVEIGSPTVRVDLITI